MKLTSRSEGAVMVEAVIVMPVFILVFSGLVALHHGWQTGLRSRGQARQRAYAISVSKSCGGHNVSADLLGMGSESDSVLAGIMDKALGLLDAVTGGTPFDFSHVRAEGKSTVSSVPRIFGGPSFTARSAEILICNEEKFNGLLDIVRKKIDEMF